MALEFQAHLGRRILQLKGNMSYRELEQDIQAKTGRRITFAMLQQLATGVKRPGFETLDILSHYAGRPVSWLFSEPAAANESPSEAARLQDTICRRVRGIEDEDDLRKLEEFLREMGG